MSNILKRLLAQPQSVEILQEFARHVKNGVTPGIFATAFLEMLKSESDSIRMPATGILTFLASRSYEDVRDVIENKVNEDYRDALRTPEAAKFYDHWLLMVKTQVGKYYEDLLKEGESFNS